MALNAIKFVKKIAYFTNLYSFLAKIRKKTRHGLKLWKQISEMNTIMEIRIFVATLGTNNNISAFFIRSLFNLLSFNNLFCQVLITAAHNISFIKLTGSAEIRNQSKSQKKLKSNERKTQMK